MAEPRPPLDPADDLAVRNLIAQLGVMADTLPIDDLDSYLACFTDDAVWEAPIGVSRGIGEIKAAAEDRRRSGAQGPGAHSRHVLSTQAVWADGDGARSESYFFAVGSTDTDPTIRIVGYYQDRLVRSPTGWRIAHRHVTFG